MADQGLRARGIGTYAYNDMLPATHPGTGEKAHLIGLWLFNPDGESNELGKSSWHLVRYADGSYPYQRIWDEKNPLTDAKCGLRGCRSLRPSPFPDEAGRVSYFCGFDKQRFKELPAAAIRHVLQDQRVHVLAIGMPLPDPIDANLKTCSGATTCTPEGGLLAEFSAELLKTDTVKKMRIESLEAKP